MEGSSRHNAADRVVVTGVGAVAPVGLTAISFWESLVEGRIGCGPVTAFDVSGQRTSVGCEVRGFDPAPLRAGGLRTGGRATAMAAAAAAEALEQAGWRPGAFPDPARAGVCLGTTMGEIRILEEHLEREVFPERAAHPLPPLSHYPCNRISEGVAGYLGFRGPTLMVPNACAAGNFALALARDRILEGSVDVMVAGGVDPYSRVAHTGFNRLLAVSPDLCRPFDAQRRGIIPGEGAGMLVLEGERRARARGARILAYFTGCGLSNDAAHMTNPDPAGSGLARAIRDALREGGVAPGDVDWISAHGTGTPANDAAETKGIRLAFGRHADRVPVSSIKSMIGHTMGAASALEAVASVMALLDGVVPPTMNHEHPDPECDLDCVPNRCRRLDVRVVLSNSAAFGGNNACVVFTRADS